MYSPFPLQLRILHAVICQPHVAAADISSSQPSQVPPQRETAPGHYATHSVLPPSPPHTPTDDRDDDAPNENQEERSPGIFCGLCSRLFSRQSTPRPNRPGPNNSGVEMAELRVRTEDDATSTTSRSTTRFATSTNNAMDRTEREQIKCQFSHDTAMIEVERLRIEAQEKETSASRAHELLVLDRQIELAHIHAASAGLNVISSYLSTIS